MANASRKKTVVGYRRAMAFIARQYDEAWPLPDGWRDRVPLHQLHLLLVHAALFGSAYRGSVLAAAAALP